MVLSVAVFANEADGAGLVWRAINKAGSLLSDLSDVAAGCSNGQILEYQTSNSTWICATDDSGSGGFTNIASAPATDAKLIQTNTTIANSATLKTLTAGTGISLTNGTSAVTITNTVTDTTGFTNIASEISPTGNATVLAQNSTGTRASFKTISAGTGIEVNNGSQSVIISSTVVDTDTNTTVLSSISNINATLIADNSTSTNNVRLKGISNGTGINIFNGTNTILIAETIKPFAQISDSTNQTCTYQNIKNVTLNTNDSLLGITHSTSSLTNQIVIDSPGLYQFIAGGQVGRTSATGVDTHNLWMTKNNVKLVDTNVRTYMAAVLNDTSVVFINWAGELAQNDIISYQQNCYQTQVVGLRANNAGIPPATPSIIITAVKLQ